jgi:hypothetical protein
MELKNIWKHSRIRFYLKNLAWNYNFWLYAKPVYGRKSYKVPVNEINRDLNIEFDYYYDDHKVKYEIKETKRFLGYMYKDSMYLDNPGIQGESEETWKVWIKKGMIRS